MTKAHEPLPAGVDPCDLPGHGHKVLRLEEARARMVADIVPVAGDEVVDLRGALGRVLAGEVRSPVDVPSHRNSAMDGYALAGEELPSTGSASLEVVGTSWAGRPFVSSGGRGQCVGNPQRFQIIEFLAQNSTCITGDIVRNTPLAQSTVSQHLMVLREAGLIRGKIEGPATCYCLDPEGFTWLKEQIGSWLDESAMASMPPIKL